MHLGKLTKAILGALVAFIAVAITAVCMNLLISLFGSAFVVLSTIVCFVAVVFLMYRIVK